MTYVMSATQYWSYRNDPYKKMKHKEIIEYLNQSLNFRGEIKSIRVIGGTK